MQLARRIANGHAYMQKDAAAMKLAPTSMDTQTERHAEAARQYHAKYGTLYDNRDQDRKLPKACCLDMATFSQGCGQPAAHCTPGQEVP